MLPLWAIGLSVAIVSLGGFCTSGTKMATVAGGRSAYSMEYNASDAERHTYNVMAYTTYATFALVGAGIAAIVIDLAARFVFGWTLE